MLRITSQSQVLIPFPQLEAPVSKLRDRGVIGKADAESRRPFRVLGPVVATSCAEGVHRWLSVRHSRATHTHAATTVTRPHFRPKLSPLSQSRAARVIEELRPLNRSQPFRNQPPCGWYFATATARRVRPGVTCLINYFADGQLAR